MPHFISMKRRILTAIALAVTLLIVPAPSALAAKKNPLPEVRPPGGTILGPDAGTFISVCKMGPYPSSGFKMSAFRQNRRVKHIVIEMTVPNNQGGNSSITIGDYSTRFKTGKWGPIRSYSGYSLYQHAVIHFSLRGTSNSHNIGSLGIYFNEMTRCP